MPFASGAAVAATQVIVGGKLNGATGVVVGAALYSVEFVDGPCTSLFSGCNSSSDFTFTTLADANRAAQALLDQVLRDTDGGSFDADYWLTYGCVRNSTNGCTISIPYSVIAGTLKVDRAINTAAIDSITPTLTTPVLDTSANEQQVYARFTASVAVPEPRSWALMLLGFCAIGFIHRARREKSTSRGQLAASQS